MTLDKDDSMMAEEVERFSKLGTLQLHHGQHQKALEAFRYAYHSVFSAGHQGYMLRACAFNLGAALIYTGNFTDGLHYLHQAVPPDGCRDGRSNGDLYFNFGLAYEGLSKLVDCKNYFEKALKEYKLEENNKKMEADTIHRLGKICVSNSQFLEAESWLKQLIQIYKDLGLNEQQLISQVERANLLQKMGKIDETQEILNVCMEAAKNLEPSENIGKLFNELGLVFCQLKNYDMAWQCYEAALQPVSMTNPKLAAVLYQNLGALCNQRGQCEEALRYHKDALQRHVELKNYRSQGHCFINMGYSYSQLNELEKAGECFQHALQASRDCGDKKTEWQSLESLGAVAFNQGFKKRAQEYYKQALTVFLGSPNAKDKNIQDRILGKLTNILQIQIEKSAPAVQVGSVSQVQEQQDQISPKRTAVLKQELKATQDGSVGLLGIKKEGKVKYLRVRKSASLRKFQKVALGLDSDLTARNFDKPGFQGIDAATDVEILSAQTLSDFEEEKDERFENPNQSFGYLNEQVVNEEGESDEMSSNEDNDENEEQRQVYEAMAKINGQEEDYMLLENPQGKSIVEQEEFVDQNESETETEGSSEQEETSDSSDSDEHSSRKVNNPSPPVPSSSPPATEIKPLGTYEVPVIKELHYETIDFSSQATSSKEKDKGERLTLTKRPSSSVNFFHSEDDEIRTGTGMSQTIYEEVGENDEVSPEQIGEANPFPSDSKLMDVNRSNQVAKENISLEKLSKAERDIFLYERHKEYEQQQRLKQEKMEAEAKEARAKTDQKSSKACNVM
ncbi:unnamed protein product [Lymnaea stagnalis]|uniref:Uncharacterized protein n=1 Tax=Lymnaea stagnalis TaxID=6523 RepID=A0AAV2I3P3_LYMST